MNIIYLNSDVYIVLIYVVHLCLFHILQIVYSGKELNHPFGLSHHGNYVFWTDYMNGSIFQLDLITSDVTLLRHERAPLFGLQIYDPRKQQGIKISKLFSTFHM